MQIMFCALITIINKTPKHKYIFVGTLRSMNKFVRWDIFQQ